MKMIRTPVKLAFVLTVTVRVCFSATMLSRSVLLLAFLLTGTSASSGTNDRMSLTPSFDFQATLETSCVLTFHWSLRGGGGSLVPDPVVPLQPEMFGCLPGVEPLEPGQRKQEVKHEVMFSSRDVLISIFTCLC